MQEIVKISVNALDMPKDQIEEDYQKLLQLVHEDKVKAVNDLESGRKDMAEYYTMWVHQIKTPIAAMRLLLQSEDTPKSRGMCGGTVSYRTVCRDGIALQQAGFRHHRFCHSKEFIR